MKKLNKKVFYERLKILEQKGLKNTQERRLYIEYLIIVGEHKKAVNIIHSYENYSTVKEYLFLEGIIYLLKQDFKAVGHVHKQLRKLNVSKPYVKVFKCGLCSKYNEKKTCGSCSFYDYFKAIKKDKAFSKEFIYFLNLEMANRTNDKKRIKKYIEKF